MADINIKYILTGILACTLSVTGCVQPDDLSRSDSDGSSDLTVTGYLVSDEDTGYTAEVDEDAGTIKVPVPYYISDTEEIQGDLTQMKVQASLPVGAKFSPGIGGIHDMEEGFTSVLQREDGTSTSFFFSAYYKESDACLITKVSLANVNATVQVVDPEDEDEYGEIIVYNTSSSIMSAMQYAVITVSPWASIDCETYDEETGYVDLRDLPNVTVVAQDGVTTTTYTTSVSNPDLVSDGTIGSIYSIWGFQTYTTDAHGFDGDNYANRTLAVVDDYLIVSNSADIEGMLVFNRNTGDLLESVSVDVTGIDSDYSIHAIGNDDANHLVAVSFTSTAYTSYTTFTIWVWEDGISSAPTQIFSKDILTDDYFADLRDANSSVTTYDIGRTVGVIGDVTSGDAIVGTVCRLKYRIVAIPLTDGTPSTDAAYVGYYSGSISTSNSSKVVFLSTDATAPEYVCSSGTYNGVGYSPAGASNGGGYYFTVPTSHWWYTSWASDAKGLDVIEFNGMKLIAIQNGSWSSSVDAYNRLYVADITTISQSSLTDGFIFDSREGDSTNGTDNIPGSGYGVTGMTSYYTFVSGYTVLGSNGNKTGDVCCAASEDGTAVQIYLLTTNHGMFAYEITSYDI